ncbi:hypothetical protein [Maribacter litopenaei]|uniref:hypothetical protein n=1 Tax=Maribacter litopenaei TaxID=2976127 RepID=UPI0030846CCA
MVTEAAVFKAKVSEKISIKSPRKKQTVNKGCSISLYRIPIQEQHIDHWINVAEEIQSIKDKNLHQNQKYKP